MKSVFTLGVGQLSWDRSERVSDRYGTVSLFENCHWQGFSPAFSLPNAKALEGSFGTLRAHILETRTADHLGDFFHGWFPGGARVGDFYALGEGILFTENFAFGMGVGVCPTDHRTTLWLNGPHLYRCHSQTVQLDFILSPRFSVS